MPIADDCWQRQKPRGAGIGGSLGSVPIVGIIYMMKAFI